jgi:hypothetical protein
MLTLCANGRDKSGQSGRPNKHRALRCPDSWSRPQQTRDRFLAVAAKLIRWRLDLGAEHERAMCSTET